MKVTMCQNVDIEAEVEVSVNDVLAEFGKRFEEAQQIGDLPVRSAYLPLVDFATRLMAQIPQQAISRCLDSQRAEVVQRLKAESERWNEIYVSAE